VSAPQGSAEWLAERAGHCTASRFKDVLATIRSGEAADRAKYRWQLVTERLTGQPVESFQNDAMRWGLEMEAAARAAYEIETGLTVELCEFVKHAKVEWVGASPDGKSSATVGLEIKCPFNSVVHVQTLGGGVPNHHIAQIQGQMWVCGFEAVDFVSFDPRMPAHLQIYVERVKRNDIYIANLAKEVGAFLEEVKRQHVSILTMRGAT
jgi:putative phage-type endonuclease